MIQENVIINVQIHRSNVHLVHQCVNTEMQQNMIVKDNMIVQLIMIVKLVQIQKQDTNVITDQLL